MNKLFKIVLKTAVLFLGILTAVFFVLYSIYSSPIPSGESGLKADELAQNILKALNYDAFQQTKHLNWSFSNHNYKWNKKDGAVLVSWADNTVLLNTNDSNLSNVQKPSNSSIKTQKELITKATSYFNNDSFWLIAPYKLFDKGIKRYYIPATKTEKASLLLTYTTGGTTPGDSYQWFVDENFIPTSFKIWVSIVPIKGLPVTWTDFKPSITGAVLAHSKKIIGMLPIPINDIHTSNTYSP